MTDEDFSPSLQLLPVASLPLWIDSNLARSEKWQVPIVDRIPWRRDTRKPLKVLLDFSCSMTLVEKRVSTLRGTQVVPIVP